MENPTFASFHNPSMAVLHTRDWAKWDAEHGGDGGGKHGTEDDVNHDSHVAGEKASKATSDAMKSSDKSKFYDASDAHKGAAKELKSAAKSYDAKGASGRAAQARVAAKAHTEAAHAADRAATGSISASSAQDAASHADYERAGV